MAIMQQSKNIVNVLLTKDIETIFTASHDKTIISIINVKNTGLFNRNVSFYTETDELISTQSLSAGASISFSFSDNEYIVGEGVKAKQSVNDGDENDNGSDCVVSISIIETIIQ